MRRAGGFGLRLRSGTGISLHRIRRRAKFAETHTPARIDPLSRPQHWAPEKTCFSPLLVSSRFFFPLFLFPHGPPLFHRFSHTALHFSHPDLSCPLSLSLSSLPPTSHSASGTASRFFQRAGGSSWYFQAHPFAGCVPSDPCDPSPSRQPFRIPSCFRCTK